MARTDCVLDGRSLTIENVVRIAREPCQLASRSTRLPEAL